tara:strand:+ start:143 stop:1111 length:969 start_codon:yes stop_codon:yes gene_type:complete
MINNPLLEEFYERYSKEKIVWDDVIIDSKLGEGGQAPVFKCEYKNSKYAVKYYDIDHYCDRNECDLEDFLESLENELKIGRIIQNSSQLMKTYGYTYNMVNGHLKIMVLLELLVCDGDLSKYIADKQWWKVCRMYGGVLKPEPQKEYVYYNKDEDIHWCYTMPTQHKVQIVCSLIKSVKELHSKGILHCDIKTDNIVLHYGPKRQIIKLIDFENSCIVDDDFDYVSSEATMGYCSSEQHNYQVSEKSDIYSLAVVIVEVWNGDIWYDGEDYEDCLQEVNDGIEKIEKEYPKLGKLLRKCLSENEEKRPYANKLLDDFLKLEF